MGFPACAISERKESLLSLEPVPSSLETATVEAEPKPPSLHWVLLLLADTVTFGLFAMIWAFVQARFARKIDAGSRAILWYLMWLCLLIVLVAMQMNLGSAPVGKYQGLFYGLLYIAFMFCYQAGNFSIKTS